MPILGDTPTKNELGALKFYLRMALTNIEWFIVQDHEEGTGTRFNMTTMYRSDRMGVYLRDKFVTCLEVLTAFSRLPLYQKYSIFQSLCMGLSQETIAERTGLHRTTISHYIRDGYVAMIGIIWDNCPN